MNKESFIADDKNTQKVCSHHMTAFKEVYEAIGRKADGRTFFYTIGGAYTGIAIIITILMTVMVTRNGQYEELRKEIIRMNLTLQSVQTEFKLMYKDKYNLKKRYKDEL